MRINLILLILMFCISNYATANEDKEKVYLTQMINQLDALKPLIIAASKEQDRNVRIQFHYTAYRDYTGTLHNGLLEDINAIKKGIEERLNQTSIEPRHFDAIKGDYLNLDKNNVKQ